MKVEVIVRIDGREVANLNQSISGQAVDMEQQTEALKDRVGQAVLPEAFSSWMGNSGVPVSVESRCTEKALVQ